MPVKVLIPTSLRKLTRGSDEVVIPCCAAAQILENREEAEVVAADIVGLISALEARFPGIKERLCDEKEGLRKFINIFVNGDDIRFLEGEKTKVKDGDEVSIIPAIAGG